MTVTICKSSWIVQKWKAGYQAMAQMWIPKLKPTRQMFMMDQLAVQGHICLLLNCLQEYMDYLQTLHAAKCGEDSLKG